MKKVFNLEKFVVRCIIHDRDTFDEVLLHVDSWAKLCDGLTEDEMADLGYETVDVWMIEVEEDV